MSGKPFALDLQRYLLIGAIAVLSFMLMTEWVKYRQSHKVAASTAVYQSQQGTAPAAPADLPDTAEPAQGTDIPAGPVATSAPATPDAGRFIKVHTDVLELQIDRNGGDIVFAALPQHSANLDTSDVPFVLLEQNDRRHYIAQSGLAGRDGIDTSAGRAQFTSAATDYRLADGADTLTVDLSYQTANQVEIIKRFTLRRGDYLVDVSYLVKNQGEQPWRGAMFGQLRRDNSDDPSIDGGGGMFGIHSYLGAATRLPDSPYQKLPFKEFKEKPLKEKLQGGWVAIVQHYFLSAWVPDQSADNEFSTLVTGDGTNIIRFTMPSRDVEPGATGEFKAQFYAGPKDQYRLEKISTGLELSVDYGVLWWIAQPLFWLLTKMHGWFGNWGWSIVGVTVIVKVLFFWLNAKAYVSMANMRKVQPKLLAIRERYADDRQKQSQEMMNLYKTEKINPLGGCLPILVQMPVFLALYWVLLESVELRHAPWILWIHDLAAMDPYFILPLLMGASMFVQQKLNPPPPDPMQAKVMQWMPVMFTFFFLWFPAGLVLYWVVNNVLSIAQQYIITKRIEAAG